MTKHTIVKNVLHAILSDKVLCVHYNLNEPNRNTGSLVVMSCFINGKLMYLFYKLNSIVIN